MSALSGVDAVKLSRCYWTAWCLSEQKGSSRASAVDFVLRDFFLCVWHTWLWWGWAAYICTHTHTHSSIDQFYFLLLLILLLLFYTAWSEAIWTVLLCSNLKVWNLQGMWVLPIDLWILPSRRLTLLFPRISNKNTFLIVPGMFSETHFLKRSAPLHCKMLLCALRLSLASLRQCI